MRLTAEHRVAIFLHGGIRGNRGKTGLTFLRYGSSPVVAVIDADCAGESLPALTGIACNAPIVASLEAALPHAPQVLLIGIAPPGGALPQAWWQELEAGVAAGLSVVNGLHTPLAPLAERLPGGTLQPGQWIWDIRQEPAGLGIGTGRARTLPCQRILTVGTDMSVGKMSASLELRRSAQERGINVRFLATGQGGLAIAGDGVPLDAVRVDYAAGAIERSALELGPECSLLLIEGQGALIHPGSTATLPLLRGSQPTGLVLVHRAGQQVLHNLPDVAIPPLPEVIRLYEAVANAAGTFGPVAVEAIALNTGGLDEPDARAVIARARQETGLPCTDAVRFGGDALLEAVAAPA